MIKLQMTLLSNMRPAILKTREKNGQITKRLSQAAIEYTREIWGKEKGTI